MTHARAAELFDRALQCPEPERTAWLAAACGDDRALFEAVSRLLRADARASAFMESPPTIIAAAHAAVPPAPQRFGAWRVLRLLGTGGMGEVWLVERDDGEFEQRAAIKQVAYPTPGLLRRFRQERQILARLEHPCIARLIDGGVGDDGTPYLVMEYVEGVPITDYVGRHALDLPSVVRLFLRVCDGVQYAHQNLVVHRDLKPSNILLTADGTPKLLDFGIAKVLATTDQAAPTQTIARLLTPDYAAPEQFRGEAITTATDVYALGVVLYELFSGVRPPRSAGTSGAARDDAAPPPPSEQTAGARRRALRGDLDRIALTALAADPTRRYLSVAAFASDLRNWLDGRPISVHRDSAWYRLRKFVRRRRYTMTTAGIAFMVCIAATLFSLHQALLAREQASRAEAVRAFLVGVFEQAAPDQNKGKPITAQQLLNIGAARLNDSAHDSVALRAELTGLIGGLYWDIGDYANAEALLTQAVAMASDTRVPDPIKAANLVWLARVEQDTNAFDRAIAHGEQALAFALRAGRAGRDAASEARRLIAAAHNGRGDAREAEPLLREALAHDRADYGERSQAVVDDLYLLGLVLKELSHLDEAVTVSRQAVDTAIALHGRLHSSVVNGLESLASALGHQGDYAASEQHLREAVGIAEQVFGPEHRETHVARSNLYWTLENQGRYAEALPGRLQQIEQLDRTMADTRPEQLAYVWNFLSSDYLGLSRFAEAEAAARKALAIWARIKGPTPDWDSADALNNLGIVQQLQGRHADAAATFRQVLAIQQAHEPPNSGWLNRTRGNLGNVLRLDHRTAEAAAELRAALAALPATATPIRASLQAMLGEAELDAGDAATAEAIATESVATARQVIPAGNPRRAAPLFALARAKLARGKADEAEALLREALAVRSPPHGADDPRVLEVKVGLALALAAQGKVAEAHALNTELEPLLRQSSSPYAADLRVRLAAR